MRFVGTSSTGTFDASTGALSDLSANGKDQRRCRPCTVDGLRVVSFGLNPVRWTS